MSRYHLTRWYLPGTLLNSWFICFLYFRSRIFRAEIDFVKLPSKIPSFLRETIGTQKLLHKYRSISLASRVLGYSWIFAQTKISQCFSKTKFANKQSFLPKKNDTFFIPNKVSGYALYFPNTEKPKCLAHGLGERRLKGTTLEGFNHFPLYSLLTTKRIMDYFLFSYNRIKKPFCLQS